MQLRRELPGFFKTTTRRRCRWGGRYRSIRAVCSADCGSSGWAGSAGSSCSGGGGDWRLQRRRLRSRGELHRATAGGVGAANCTAEVLFVSSEAKSAFVTLKRGLHRRVPCGEGGGIGAERQDGLTSLQLNWCTCQLCSPIRCQMQEWCGGRRDRRCSSRLLPGRTIPRIHTGCHHQITDDINERSRHIE